MDGSEGESEAGDEVDPYNVNDRFILVSNYLEKAVKNGAGGQVRTSVLSITAGPFTRMLRLKASSLTQTFP